MGESARDEQLALVVLAQFYRHILSEGGRAATDVHGHIYHRAAYDAHELRLAIVALLIVETTQHAIARLRLVVLHKFHMVADMIVKLLLLPCFEEVAARVFEHFRLYNPYALNGRFDVFHNNWMLFIYLAQR